MDKAYDEAIRYLSRRMHTIKETSTYLAGKGHPAGDIERAIEALKDYGYLNDSAYASVYISSALGKGRSIHRILKELKIRGISSQDAESGLERNFSDSFSRDNGERERALLEAKKIIDRAGVADHKTLARAGRRLATLGYPAGLIYAVLSEFQKEDPR